MSWGSTFKKAAKKVKKAVNKVADKIADAIETGGNKACDLLNRAGNYVRENVPIIGPALGAFVRWTGSISSGVCDLAGAVVKAIGSTIGGIVAGGLLIVGGMIKDGILTMLTGLLGGVLLVIGKLVSLVQIVFVAESRKRRLTAKEIAMLKNVFRSSVSLFNIRVVEGKSGVFDFSDRAFTMGNTVYLKGTSPAEWESTLVHETTHVWQYQNLGSSYASDALGAQLYYKFVKNRSAYSWWDPAVNNVETVWEEWNREAAAEFIEDLYMCGESHTKGQPWVGGSGRFYAASGAAIERRFCFNGATITEQDPCGSNRTDFTVRADQAVLALREEHTDRGSSTLM